MTIGNSNFIPREASESIKRLAKQFRVVSVVGPRQSGKTTILKKIFPEKSYISLEDLRNRDFAKQDPVGFLEQFKDGAFIDEVHHAPGLLSQIQVKVDQDKRRGQFLLSGSNNILVSALGSQSLAGRAASFILLPLSVSELINSKLLKKDMSLTAQLRGGYPEIWEQNLSSTLVSSAYVASYVERDVRQIANIGELSVFRKFIELTASNTGQLLNKESFSNALGIVGNTIERWFSILEATYVAFRLKPWSGNVKKRLVKSPKVYFYDTALLCYLLGIESEEVLNKHPLKGQIFENMQVVEYFKWAYNSSKEPRANFYRDSAGNEVDLVSQINSKTQSIEIKSSASFKEIYNKGITKFQDINNNQHKPLIVLGANESQKRSDFDVSSWYALSDFLNQRIK